MGSKTVYQNWIADLGQLPGQSISQPALADIEIEHQVTAAIDLLDREEKELIIRFHFMGETYKEISRISGRQIHKLTSMHKRSLRKLRIALAGFADRRYGISTRAKPCILCESGHREEIDRLLASKEESQTWRPIIKELLDRFSIRITTPQQLIGHFRYHMIDREEYREAE